MKRWMALMLVLPFAVGIVVGGVGSHLLNAQQAPLKVTDLLRADVVGVDGKEAVMQLVEFLPGGASGKHYHPGHSFGYVLEGALTVESDGHPPVTARAGEVTQEVPGHVHDAKNLTGSPLKLFVLRVHPKGQPVTVRVTEPYFVK